MKENTDWRKTSINERIKHLSEVYTGGLMNKFAQKIDISTSTLGDIVGKKQNSPSFDTLKSIMEHINDVNADWLVTGEGEMFKLDKSVSIFTPEDLPKQVGRLYLAPIYESYPVSAGNMGLSAVRDEKPDGYAYTTMPGVTFFPVVGCSFEPIIKAGHYIGTVKIESWDRVDTEKIYFIVTREERMIKRLRIDEDDHKCLWCVSPNFHEFKILKSDVIEVSHVFFYGMMI